MPLTHPAKGKLQLVADQWMREFSAKYWQVSFSLTHIPHMTYIPTDETHNAIKI